jgi:hypothetical protein
MRLLEKVEVRRSRKSWSGEPTIWEQDALRYALWGATNTWSDQEKPPNDFVSYFLEAISCDPIVFGVTERRRQVFSQANFMWQTLSKGRGTELSSSEELDLLRNPWPGGHLPELLDRLESDATAAGNFYATLADDNGRLGNAARGSATARIARLRPDWITIVVAVPKLPDVDANDPRARVVSYLYRTPRSSEPWTFLPEEIVHYKPIPDTLSRHRGMSWLTPVLLEVMSDKAATSHKINFFRNGAVHSMALKYPPNTSLALLREYKAIFDAEYQGVANHYKTFHVAGADPIPMSADFRQLELKVTQGAGETRIALAGGVPAVILGSSEGMQGSSLNQGNFAAARRLFVDTTIRDLWAKAAPALQTVVTPPQKNQRLWYDGRDIPFLREDAADDAKIKTQDAQTIKALVDTGADWDAAVKYVQTGDMAALIGKQVNQPVQVQQGNAPTGDQPAPRNGSRSNGNTQQDLARS